MVQWFKSQQDLPAVLLPTVHSHEEPRNGVYNCICEGNEGIPLQQCFKRLWFTPSMSLRKVWG